jgi:tryptophan synthase alpha chain
MHRSILTAAIQEGQGSKPQALIPFLPAGFPSKDRFWGLVQELDASGADVIEIGVPFSDPVADGPVIESVSMDCLQQGVDLEWILEGAKRQTPTLKAPIVCMGYYNPFWRYGLERFAARARRAGIAGCIVPDLPLEESALFQRHLNGHGLDLIRMLGLNTTIDRMRAYAQGGSGFIYMVAALGITGCQGGLPAELALALSKARQTFTEPIALGFGLESKEQLLPLAGMIDAVVFGTSLIRHIQHGGTAGAFLQRWH